MDTPPHARIVADIKQRVTDGRLRPGERVPSTRQLARDWNVALATAAKALTLLAREGVVVAEPRVGTVVAERPGSPARPRPGATAEHELTRRRIVRAAMEIADADGLSELTMRAVAGRLGVATMSLYRHVGGKDDLVMLMVDAAFAEFPLPARHPDGWRGRLETSARVQWAAYRAHPWMAGATPLTRPVPSQALLLHSEFVMEMLQETGLDATTRMYVMILIYSFVQGIAAHIELEQRARASTGITDEEWMSGQEEFLRDLTAANPAFGRLLDELGDFDLDLDRLFTFGLESLLDGLTRLVEPR
ncbi:TetR/AcrR family transcriptional regulator C-terminal domain-containing protein [Nonomuraea gerenzanensis]|uniref:Transcriptional regulator, GntR family / Transcriptional regulator, TetR family n=1 Tax=Nonomuraea gerenzanensis TaxID=93944 RepID=A0A1M4DZ95_9ACTN|nr:TetR/AcrR family transcriptional regulator C-terminal domain-containing protein [Nonomuraea gerenzanensis]UBU14198.1 TetR/AcrR family transcriptional regulator C-terminal domain-containing protein [Nonomuraea gerenzanensis]SBO91891.1 Transcriptional regulator, GntR family / Transcriptional regulator, TetR family [Nonomuraea gerenzanensis]